METLFIFILAFAIQAYVCFRGRKLIGKLIPLILSLAVEAAGWLCVFIFPDPSVDMAAGVLLTILWGINLLGGVTLGWFVYGVIRAVQKLIH